MLMLIFLKHREISEQMKRKTTKEILADSFRELAGSKAANKITVQEISENCGYSSATFYRHFRDKYDLMAWDYLSHCKALMKEAAIQEGSWEASVISVCIYLDDQKQYMKNLFEHTGGQDSFIQNMAEINMELLHSEICRISGEGKLDGLEFYIRFFSYGTVQMLWEWLTGEYRGSAEVIAEAIIHALPAPLVPLLRENETK